MRKLAVAMLAFGAASCVGEGDIDRTQANKLPKALFQGTWYVQSTVSDVPSTNATAFVGIPSNLEKIVWEIQEDHLIAWRSYEEVPGTDRERVDEAVSRPFETVPATPRDLARTDDFVDTPVAAFPILGHFDVKRGYNASTGEQTNVIEENTSDRPWYEREYIRVDWSDRQLAYGDFFFDWWIDSTIEMEYYVQQNEGGEDAFRILAKGEEGDARLDFDDIRHKPDASSAYYMDMVGRATVQPAAIDFFYFQIPWCWIIPSYNPYLGASCGDTTMEIRSSFLKVDQSHEGYEPLVMDDRDMGRFGYFRTERFTYDRLRGFTEPGRIYLANRHNLWQDSYESDLDEDGTKVWRTDELGQRVRIPYEDRTAKPIVYHLSPDYPAELMDVTERIGAEWNHVFRRAVAVAQGCITSDQQNVDDLPREPSDPDSESGECYVPDMFLVHGNGWLESIEGQDDASPYLNYWADGERTYDPAYTEARIGDIRFNFLAWVDNVQLSGPHGFGPSNADPETGEIITGMAHVYGAVTDSYSEYALDIVRVLNGDLDVDDLVDADYVREQVTRNLQPVDVRNMSSELSNIPASEAAQMLLGTAKMQRIADVREMIRTGDEMIANANPLIAQQRIGMIRGTPAEQFLLSGEVLRELYPAVTGQPYDPGSPPAMSEELIDQLNPSMRLGPLAIDLRKYREDFAARHNIWTAESTDLAVLGLAQQYMGRTDYDQVRRELRDAIYLGVQLHEIGHTVGLRHNFSGSYDSMNYFDRYWELREENLLHVITDNYWTNSDDFFSIADLLTQSTPTDNQLSGRMSEYAYSTVMDYGSRFNSDIHGLGRYDAAAVLFGYTSHVEVLDPESYLDDEWERHAADDRFTPEERETRLTDEFKATRANQLDFNLRQILQLRLSDCTPMFEESVNPAQRTPADVLHYTQVPDLMFGNQHPVDSDLTNESWRGLRYRSFASWPELQAQQEEATTACRERVGDSGCDPDQVYVGSEKCLDLVGDNWTVADEGTRPVQVPYMFCSDEWVGALQSCQRYDRGAGPYEQVTDRIQAYNFDYWFTHFKRDRIRFTSWGTMERSYGRYFAPMVNAYQQYLFSPKYDDTIDDYWLFGMFAGFHFLLDQIAMPQYGEHEFDDEELQWEPAYFGGGDPEQTTFLDRDVARLSWSDYDWSDGYYYFYKVKEAGHFYDFVGALYALTAVTANVVGVGSNNFLSYFLPYYLVFPEELQQFFEGLYTQSYDQYAPRIIDGKPQNVLRGVLLNNGDLVDGATWRTLPDPNAGYPVAPISSFSFRVWSMFLAMALFPAGFDNEFLFRQRVFLVGTGEDIEPGAGWERQTCANPNTGVSYGALCDPGVSDDLATASCKQILKCQGLVNQCETQGINCFEAADEIYYLEIQRSLYSIFGYGFF